VVQAGKLRADLLRRKHLFAASQHQLAKSPPNVKPLVHTAILCQFRSTKNSPLGRQTEPKDNHEKGFHNDRESSDNA